MCKLICVSNVYSDKLDDINTAIYFKEQLK